MSKLNLTIATTDYDHFRDFRLGDVKAEGIDHNWLNLGHHECFARFTANREFDLAELSFAKFTTQVTRKESDIIGLPVVCSRLFRFSSFYVNRKSKIATVEDLKGKKIGSPEWAHSAAVYMRGWMHNEMGVKLTDVHYNRALLEQDFECRGRGAVRGALPVRAPKHVSRMFYVSDLEYPPAHLHGSRNIGTTDLIVEGYRRAD